MDLELQKFANVLTVFARETDDNSRFEVYWRSGVNRQGKVLVHIPVDVQDKRAVAELTAMQHLIEEGEVIGATPPLKGLKLAFSVPVIKKLHRNISEKRYLYPYAYFLTTRFAAAAVGIEDDSSWIKPRAELYVTEIVIEEPPGEWIHVNQIGKVSITRHVIDQFTQRMNNIEPDVAWKFLAKTLSTATLVRLDDTDERKELDRIRHPSEGVRHFDNHSKWCFVIATNRQGKPTIATAYLRL